MRGTQLQLQLQPAQVVRGRYMTIERVGQGAVGAVYRVLDLVTNQHRALKHLLRTSPALKAEFAREARILAELCHPSLPTASDFFVQGGQPLLVMSLVDGPDLGHLLALQGRPFELPSVLQWADQLLDALAYLHARGIVHHDIKPRNVNLDTSGRAVLVDFGLAAVEREACGYTATYAPPEQVRGQRTDARSDLYALGATLYELLTRRSPPAAQRRVATIEAGGPDPLLPVRGLNSLVPRDVEALVTRALALEPDGRPSSARELQVALARVGKLDALYGGEPRGRAVGVVESRLSPSRLDCRHTPPGARIERAFQIWLADGVRTRIQTDVTEAQHIQRCTWVGHGRETCDVTSRAA